MARQTSGCLLNGNDIDRDFLQSLNVVLKYGESTFVFVKSSYLAPGMYRASEESRTIDRRFTKPLLYN